MIQIPTSYLQIPKYQDSFKEKKKKKENVGKEAISTLPNPEKTHSR